jgi:uncharacterized protein (TIGR03118 family)
MKLKKNVVLLSMLVCAASAALTACGGDDNNGGGTSTPPTAGQFRATVLTSDGSVAAANIDPNLQNAWGLAESKTSVIWNSDNGTKKSSLHDGNGVTQSLVVTIPPNVAGAPAGPTGMVNNPSTADFMISDPSNANAQPFPAVFMWATDAGTIAAWSPNVLPTAAVNEHDDSAGGAVYKGLTVASNNGANFLYAADFHNKTVNVFDRTFTKVKLAGSFTDPNLPAGFSPFGIQAINTSIFVAYAELGPDGKTQVKGAGLGVVDQFDTAGNFIKRLVTGGVLNAPWGMVQAPANFGAASNQLLIGNFGDGALNMFNPTTGALEGPLLQTNGQPFVQSGLWGLLFGNDTNNQPSNTLFYSAGPTPTTGVFGRIDLMP